MNILNFDGYWREPNWKGLPEQSGIYCIYACIHYARENAVKIERLLYIGESEDVQERIFEGRKSRRDRWAEELLQGEVLCANFAEISPTEIRERVEAAMIYHHQPPCNIKYALDFPFCRTSVRTSGENALLDSSFRVP